MMSNSIPILCSTDDNYVPYTGIMLTSLFENNRDVSFEIYILTRGLNESNIARLKALELKYKATVLISRVSLSMFENCPIRPGDHVTIETYFRLLAPYLLPENIDRILYLDGDIVVDGPIRELWDWDIEQYAIGAVIDESFCNGEIYTRLGLDNTNPYFSAGVLLLNLKYWRDKDVSNRCMKCISNNPDILSFHDQDTLNIVLKDEKTFLPITFNFQTGFFLSWVYPGFPESFKEQVLKCSQRPCIIHYSGPMKPWTRSSDHPYRKRYLHYRGISEWKHHPLVKDTSIWSLVRLYVGRFAKRFGLLSRKYVIN